MTNDHDFIVEVDITTKDEARIKFAHDTEGPSHRLTWKEAVAIAADLTAAAKAALSVNEHKSA